MLHGYPVVIDVLSPATLSNSSLAQMTPRIAAHPAAARRRRIDVRPETYLGTLEAVSPDLVPRPFHLQPSSIRSALRSSLHFAPHIFNVECAKARSQRARIDTTPGLRAAVADGLRQTQDGVGRGREAEAGVAYR